MKFYEKCFDLDELGDYECSLEFNCFITLIFASLERLGCYLDAWNLCEFILVLKERSNTFYELSGLSYALWTFGVCELLLCN